MTLSVCGGTVPMAGLTMVSVRASHRRRGVLRRMLAAHLGDARGRGEPVSGLWASDARIYGRFGYGVAAEGDELTAGPDEGLARYEWRRHGTCSGLSPNEYFAAAKSARAAVTIPPQFKDPHAGQSLSPAAVEHAFLDANPRLRPGMVAAECRDGTLDEVRICFSKDLDTFQLCPEVVRSRCHSETMSVPAVR